MKSYQIVNQVIIKIIVLYWKKIQCTQFNFELLDLKELPFCMKLHETGLKEINLINLEAMLSNILTFQLVSFKYIYIFFGWISKATGCCTWNSINAILKQNFQSSSYFKSSRRKKNLHLNMCVISSITWLCYLRKYLKNF